jgi:GT2 family glycosyltransferase
MDLSIIIPSFNTKELTIGCIKSIDNDNSDLVKEIIVVDNASNDGTVAAINKLNLSKTKITVVENEENVGFAKACNKGIRRSLGRFILLLNSDTEIVSGSLQKLVEYAESTSSLGLVGAKLLNSDGSVQPSCFRLPTIFRTVEQYWLGKKNILDKYYPKENDPVEVEGLVGAAILITPICIKKVGLLDEKYFMYFEDLDYCRRVRSRGLKVVYLPSAGIVHFHGESGKDLEPADKQWKRLIPSSKIYHGIVGHYLLFFIMWSSQKWQKYLKK